MKNRSFFQVIPFILLPIFGPDNREEIETLSLKWKTHSQAIAGLVTEKDVSSSSVANWVIRPHADGQSFEIETTPYTQNKHVMSSPALCKDIAFYGQPTAPHCTAFLVTEDLMLTAGHCIDTKDCSKTHFIFDFTETKENTTSFTSPKDNIYQCKKIVAREFTEFAADWALVQLDRKVQNRKPLKLSTNSVLPDELATIGHPEGLPLKADLAALLMKKTFIVQEKQNNASELRAYDSRGSTHPSPHKPIPPNPDDYEIIEMDVVHPQEFFYFSSDMAKGASGSPVMDHQGEVKGILVRGNPIQHEFDEKNKCYRPLDCTVAGVEDLIGEKGATKLFCDVQATRVSYFFEKIKKHIPTTPAPSQEEPLEEEF